MTKDKEGDIETLEGVSGVAGNVDRTDDIEVLEGAIVDGVEVEGLFATHARSCKNSCRVTRNFLQEEEPAL